MTTSNDLLNFQKNILDQWTCIICMDYAINIKVSTCSCATVFCEECTKNLKNCPLCRKILNLSTPHFKILNMLREIPEYKKKEEEEEKKNKVPSKEEIEALFLGGKYYEDIDMLNDKQLIEKISILSRRIIYGFLTNIISKKEDEIIIYDWTHTIHYLKYLPYIHFSVGTYMRVIGVKNLPCYSLNLKNNLYLYITLNFSPEHIENIKNVQEIPRDVFQHISIAVLDEKIYKF